MLIFFLIMVAVAISIFSSRFFYFILSVSFSLWFVWSFRCYCCYSHYSPLLFLLQSSASSLSFLPRFLARTDLQIHLPTKVSSLSLKSAWVSISISPALKACNSLIARIAKALSTWRTFRLFLWANPCKNFAMRFGKMFGKTSLCIYLSVFRSSRRRHQVSIKLSSWRCLRRLRMHPPPWAGMVRVFSIRFGLMCTNLQAEWTVYTVAERKFVHFFCPSLFASAEVLCVLGVNSM